MSSSAPVDAVSGGVPVLALTIAVGAIFALIFIIVHVFGKQFSQEAKQNPIDANRGTWNCRYLSVIHFIYSFVHQNLTVNALLSDSPTNGHVSSGVEQAKEKNVPKKKQVQRKEKPKQDTFTHSLLVTNLKGAQTYSMVIFNFSIVFWSGIL